MDMTKLKRGKYGAKKVSPFSVDICHLLSNWRLHFRVPLRSLSNAQRLSWHELRRADNVVGHEAGASPQAYVCWRADNLLANYIY